jgi:catechol 2,3-dioxygenase-like lactoylglutathione lyase family enzyme
MDNSTAHLPPTVGVVATDDDYSCRHPQIAQGPLQTHRLLGLMSDLRLDDEESDIAMRIGLFVNMRAEQDHLGIGSSGSQAAPCLGHQRLVNLPHILNRIVVINEAISPWLSERHAKAAGLSTIELMAIKKMEHVGIVVDDLPAAIEFFVELGLEPGGKGQVEGEWVDRIIALDGTRAELAMLRTPDGHGEIELVKFHSPPTPDGDPQAPSNALGIRHVLFAVEGIDDVLDRLRAHGAELVGGVEQYENSYRLCYVRGPEGIIIELAEEIG